MYDIFYLGKKDSQFTKLKENFITIKQADSFEIAQKKCITKFFWCVWDDIIVSNDFVFDYTPDEWSQDVVHAFKNDRYNDGIWLSPKDAIVSAREIEHRFLVSKKEVDIIASVPKPYDYFLIDSYEEYLQALETSKTEMFWCSSQNIQVYDIGDFYFEYYDRYNRTENHVFQHVVKDNILYNGLMLMSKHKPVSKREIEHRHLVSRKEWDKIGSGPKAYEQFIVETYDDYIHALEKTKTEMFWGRTTNIDTGNFNFDIYFTHDDTYNRKENHAFIHRVNDKDYYNGLFLFSKHKPVSKREIEYRHLVQRKEWDIVASGPTEYFGITVDSYEDYEYAMTYSPTELFYAVPSQVIVTEMPSLYFTHDDEYNRKENHSFKNVCNGEEKDNGIFLLSKHKPLSKRELEFRHIVYKKSWDIVASKHKPYDVVFMSYNEENADANYDELLNRCPNAKRVHGVKGIHQAHIAAAKLCESEMVWIIDADAILMDDFNFELFVEKWDRETVHVWRSKNPINDLVYGYGGVKLFPRLLTINMDTSKPDMTTSITDKFKAVPVVSNITAFNTDPYNTWKSAFRECCKLSSKIIDRQKVQETNERLDIWCTVGKDKKFGEYAIAGAKAGREYGSANRNNIEALKKINDFDWLKEHYDKKY